MKIPTAGLSVVLLVALVFLARPWVLEDLDNKAFDLLAAWAGGSAAAPGVAIVEIDEFSLSQAGPWPWPRARMAALIRRIFDAGAVTVVLDLVLPRRQDPTAAQAAPGGATPAQSLTGLPVVVGFSFLFDSAAPHDAACAPPPLSLVLSAPESRRDNPLFRAPAMLCSDPDIGQVAKYAGFLNAAPDHDGRYRRLPLVIEHGGSVFPSLALAAYLQSVEAAQPRLSAGPLAGSILQIGAVRVPLEDPGCLRLRFRGPRRAFPYFPAAGILSGNAPEPGLRGKTVLIGLTAAGLQDHVPTPLDSVHPGVELHATAIDNLLRADFFHRPAEAGIWELALALAVAIAASLVLRFVLWPWSALFAAAIVAAPWAICFLLLSKAGIVLSAIPPSTVAAGQCSVLAIAARRREKQLALDTERRLRLDKERALQALETSERRYRQLVENVNDAIIVCDPGGTLLFANRRFCDWFGVPAGNLGNVRLDDCVAAEWRQSLREWTALVAAGQPVPDRCEFEGLRGDGSRFWVEASFSIAEENGSVAGIQSALRDITARKQIEAQYLQAQKMESIGRLAGSVAHDFNNLLTVINGYAEFLYDSDPADSGLKHGLMEIRAAGERAADLTANLLAFSRMQRARPRPLDLNAALEDALALCRRMLGGDIEIVTRFDPSAPHVTADPGQLHQVLMNLAVNARDAMPGGGTFIVQTSVAAPQDQLPGRPAEAPTGPYARLDVFDTGVGMTGDVKLRLFEPYFTTKEHGKGTGLGLSTVFGIVTQSGGWIAVDSEPGAGSRFSIFLPLTIAADRSASTSNPPAPRLPGTETILLVEHQESVLRFFSNVLLASGYRVLGVSSGPAAVDIARDYSAPIHLLLADLELPRMSGHELASQLRQTRPSLEVIFTSGRFDPDSGSPPGRGEAWLAKPCTPAELTAKVRAALAGRSAV